jgi:hypothetical protein
MTSCDTPNRRLCAPRCHRPVSAYTLIWMLHVVFFALMSAGLSVMLTACSNSTQTGPPEPTEFVIPMDIGTKWQYSFSCAYGYPLLGQHINRRGIHTWQLISKTQVGDTVLITIASSQIDSLYLTYYYQGPLVPTDDTSFFFSQTIPFTVKITPDSILYDWATSLSTGWPNYKGSLSFVLGPVDHSLQTIPRVAVPNTIATTVRYGTSTYVSRIGLNSFKVIASPGHTSQTATFQFIKFLSQ